MAMPMNMTYEQMFRLLELVNKYYAYTQLPTSGFLIGMGVVGFVGNTVSIYIFLAKMKRNLQNDLLAYLTSLSIMVCVVSIPRELTDVFLAFVYPDLWLCKIGRYTNTFATGGQVIVLTALAIVRYRAVCVGKPIQLKSGYVIFGLVVLTAFLSVSAPIVFGFRTTPTFIRGIMGRDCSIGDDVVHTPWPLVYNVELGVGFSNLVVVTAFCYFRIWWVVKENNKKMSAHTREEDRDGGKSSANQKSQSKKSESSPGTGNGSVDTIPKKNESSGQDVKKGGGNAGNKRRSLENSITLSAFVLTFIFILTYLPFFLVSIPRFFDQHADYSNNVVLLNVMNISIRFYFISSASNPFIFFISNVEFRRHFYALCGCSGSR